MKEAVDENICPFGKMFSRYSTECEDCELYENCYEHEYPEETDR